MRHVWRWLHRPVGPLGCLGLSALVALLVVVVWQFRLPPGPPPDAPLVAWRGLPSPMMEPEVHEMARVEGSRQIASSGFELQPVDLGRAAEARLRAVFATETVYGWRNPLRRCLFHADYAVRWADVSVLLCYGCGEVKYVRGGELRRFEMSEAAAAALQRALPRRNSPAE